MKVRQIEYRLAKRGEDEYFPQVRMKKFFWSKWNKIATHPTGYGLYSLPDWNYPKTKEEALEIIDNYHTWLIEENKLKDEVTYLSVTPKKPSSDQNQKELK